ncbi:MAG: preprotein translocase subunit SecA [Ferrovum myxofaciens]|uniref:Protein translocase subunit SecA n=1 Tax=Ferrovum myxofaciens TaxID=416213 RepID=A0A9E6N147_9PROT|nr:preprotein translocase subunit SecA [Ferrovum myxofaciens]QKE38511.2 MAG: preprotein translocase subunit SecA [Ferrovum myxofaciens]QWY76165.1 MAG: preprotein translocase subunit SecA [Ferrovum myxofaciens]QWY78825.1 MAG: preprotein translocase subunit SecA [Ferrovum myxofaciens]
MTSVLKKIFGSRNERLLKQYRKIVTRINALESNTQGWDDATLQRATEDFRQRLKAGETLDALLPEAFAVVREASRRVLGMRHFDVQLLGGLALHYGKIAEMRTGEGKTLVSTLPAYLNALTGKGVHVVTVNDYLARRDAEWMGRIHRFLGLSVGVNLSQMSHDDKVTAYAADITYGTNNEFGFDYLRDNMVSQVGERVQRSLHFAIVDEVDSILIDEARTPLIISGQSEDNTTLYLQINQLIPELQPQATEEGEGDYWVDLKAHSVTLSEQGHERAENLLGEAGLLPDGASLYDPAHILLMHHVYAGLRAHALYHRDQHYVVQNGEVVIVDEFTGRMMPGRRWSEGIHQAIEAKEQVDIQNESQTLASITFQNYFRLYEKLAGMTGTADTEAFEFQHIYGLETVLIPPHRVLKRQDRMDQVFRSGREKFQAIVADVRDCHQRGQPVLVGTTSIEASELVSRMLQQEKLPHQVLNAKHHAREAEIVAQAGQPGMITIATNMAGRGTDIVLGGNPEEDQQRIEQDPDLTLEQRQEKQVLLTTEWKVRHEQVVSLGGLHIIGTERHESRRIDNQLRGRSGRQGDPGSSRFYLSLEDPLLKIFASDRVAAIMDRLKMPEGEAIEHPWVTRAIENAQRKVEARNFDVRKQLLEYDDVANDQRKVIYGQRKELLEAQDIASTIQAMRQDVLAIEVARALPPDAPEEVWDMEGLQHALREFSLDCPIRDWLSAEPTLNDAQVLSRVQNMAETAYQNKIAPIEPGLWHGYERAVMLQVLDSHWREHLAALDHLRQGIHLRGYAQKNPKQEYKREAFELFGLMLDAIKREVTRALCRVEITTSEAVAEATERVVEEDEPGQVSYQHGALAVGDSEEAMDEPPEKRVLSAEARMRVGRNDPCPCGSGKKYKHCHGRL